MVVVGGIVGAIVGFGLGLLITEVIIGNPPDQTGFDWVFWFDIVLLVIGAIAGAGLLRRLRERSSVSRDTSHGLRL